jgi:hypothetical protein
MLRMIPMWIPCDRCLCLAARVLLVDERASYRGRFCRACARYLIKKETQELARA